MPTWHHVPRRNAGNGLDWAAHPEVLAALVIADAPVVCKLKPRNLMNEKPSGSKDILPPCGFTTRVERLSLHE